MKKWWNQYGLGLTIGVGWGLLLVAAWAAVIYVGLHTPHTPSPTTYGRRVTRIP